MFGLSGGNGEQSHSRLAAEEAAASSSAVAAASAPAMLMPVDQTETSNVFSAANIAQLFQLQQQAGSFLNWGSGAASAAAPFSVNPFANNIPGGNSFLSTAAAPSPFDLNALSSSSALPHFSQAAAAATAAAVSHPSSVAPANLMTGTRSRKPPAPPPSPPRTRSKSTTVITLDDSDDDEVVEDFVIEVPKPRTRRQPAEVRSRVLATFAQNPTPTAAECEVIAKEVALTGAQVARMFRTERERLRKLGQPLPGAEAGEASVNESSPPTDGNRESMADIDNVVDDGSDDKEDAAPSTQDTLEVIANEHGALKSKGMVKFACQWVLAERTPEEKRRFLSLVAKSEADILNAVVESKILPGMGNWMIRAVKEGDTETVAVLLKAFLVLPIGMVHLKANTTLPKAVKAVTKKFDDKDVLKDAELLMERWKELPRQSQEQEAAVSTRQEHGNPPADSLAARPDVPKKRSREDLPGEAAKRAKLAASTTRPSAGQEASALPKFSRVTRPPSTTPAAPPPDIFSALVSPNVLPPPRTVAAAKPKLQTTIARLPSPEKESKSSTPSPRGSPTKDQAPVSSSLPPQDSEQPPAVASEGSADQTAVQDDQQSPEQSKGKGLRIRHRAANRAGILKKEGKPLREKMTIRWRDNAGGELCAVKLFHKDTEEENVHPHLGVVNARALERMEGRQAFGREHIEPRIAWTSPSVLEFTASGPSRGAQSQEQPNQGMLVHYADELLIPPTPGSPLTTPVADLPVRPIGSNALPNSSDSVKNATVKQFLAARQAKSGQPSSVFAPAALSSAAAAYSPYPPSVPPAAGLPAPNALQDLMKTLALLQSVNPSPQTAAALNSLTMMTPQQPPAMAPAQHNHQFRPHINGSNHYAPRQYGHGNNQNQPETQNLNQQDNRRPRPYGGQRKVGTVPCMFWKEGRCRKGDACTFRHD
ncbi:hypothetical protein RI367_002006 [Sorochytrium milnesiophthora]